MQVNGLSCFHKFDSYTVIFFSLGTSCEWRFVPTQTDVETTAYFVQFHIPSLNILHLLNIYSQSFKHTPTTSF